MKYIQLSLILILLLGHSGGLSANEGALEINQACVAAGCFPGDSPGLPVEVTQPGSYVLTSNLTLPLPTNEGIRLLASNVTLDMKGFSVLGVNTCDITSLECVYTGGGCGIYSNPNQNHIKIANGHIRGMGLCGIQLEGQHHIVEGITVQHTYSVGILVGSNSVVRNCTVSSSGMDGITAPLSVISNCVSSANFNHGIVVERSTVEGVSARSNGGSGILDYLGSQIRSSVVSENNHGVESFHGGTSIVNSTIIQNRFWGVNNNGIADALSPGMPVFLRENILLQNGTKQSEGDPNLGAQWGNSGSFVELGKNFCGVSSTCPGGIIP